MIVQTIDRAELDAGQNLAFEQDLFKQLRLTPRPACLFYVCNRCIVLGRNNRPADWVHLAAAEADGVPVLRRFSGGGTVYLDHDVLNYSFIVPRPALEELTRTDSAQSTCTLRYIDFFLRLVIDALGRGGGGYSVSGTSDISLNGRKISGNAQRIAATLVLHHGTLLMRSPLAAIERYLPLPPDRPGVPHAAHITGLAEQGRTHGPATLKAWLRESFSKSLESASS